LQVILICVYVIKFTILIFTINHVLRHNLKGTLKARYYFVDTVIQEKVKGKFVPVLN
jgi:hypothetical protein